MRSWLVLHKWNDPLLQAVQYYLDVKADDAMETRFTFDTDRWHHGLSDWHDWRQILTALASNGPHWYLGNRYRIEQFKTRGCGELAMAKGL